MLEKSGLSSFLGEAAACRAEEMQLIAPFAGG